ncbi:hypothetical protein N0V88_001197 [Collariella sp. IMI 366227]|nr:hypothetical protein N0V88_001197 [Collariella sp. IMI 366227]
MPIKTWTRAVEGISGAGVFYTILALLTLFFAPDHPFPAFLMMIFDVAFIGGFIYIATANRGGASSCNGEVDTPYGKGNADTNVVSNGKGGFTTLPSLRQACKMETACLAVSIVAIFFFIFSPLLSLALVRHRRRQQRLGASTANEFTASGFDHDTTTTPTKRSKLFGFLRRRNTGADASHNPNALPAHTSPDDVRGSYATEQTRVGSSSGYRQTTTGGGYGGLGDGSSKWESSPYGKTASDEIPLGTYPNRDEGYQYAGQEDGIDQNGILIRNHLATGSSSAHASVPVSRSAYVTANHASAQPAPAVHPASTCRTVWYPRYTRLHATSAATTIAPALTRQRCGSVQGVWEYASMEAESAGVRRCGMRAGSLRRQTGVQLGALLLDEAFEGEVEGLACKLAGEHQQYLGLAG